MEKTEIRPVSVLKLFSSAAFIMLFTDNQRFAFQFIVDGFMIADTDTLGFVFGHFDFTSWEKKRTTPDA